mgnify:CR=1 FL=1
MALASAFTKAAHASTRLDHDAPTCWYQSAGRPALPAALVQGKLQACRYFFAYELPKIDAWLAEIALA